MPPQIKSAAGAVKEIAARIGPAVLTTGIEMAQATGNNPGGNPGIASFTAAIVRRQIFGA